MPELDQYDELIERERLKKEQREGSVTPTGGDPYESFIDNVTKAKRVTLEASLNHGSKQDPDAKARAVALAKHLQLPVETVEANPENAARLARLGALDLDALRLESPATAKWLENPTNAAIAHDDIASLRQIERTARQLTPGEPEPDTPELRAAIESQADRIWQTISEQRTRRLQTPVPGDGGPGQADGGPVSEAERTAPTRQLEEDFGPVENRDQVIDVLRRSLRLPSLLPQEGLARAGLRNLQSGVVRLAGALTGTPEWIDEANEMGDSAARRYAPATAGEKVVGAVTGSVPALATVALTRGRVAGLFARNAGRTLRPDQVAELSKWLVPGEIAGLSFAQNVQDRTQSPGEAILNSILEGAFTRAGGAFEPFLSAAGATGGKLAKEIGKEALEEGATSASQDIVSQTLGKEAKPYDLLRTLEAAGLGAAAGTIFAGAFGIPRAMADRYAKQANEAGAAQDHADAVTQLVDLVAASKTGQRAPEEVASLVEQTLGQSGRFLFVDSDAFREAFADPAAAAQLLGVSEEYALALPTRGQVQIPTARLIQVAAKNQTFKTLLERYRRTPTSVSALEAAEFEAKSPDALRQLQSEARAAAAESTKPDDFRREVSEIEDELFRRMNEVHRPNVDRGALRDVAKSLASNFGALSQRTGKSPRQLFTVKLRGDMQRVMRGDKFDLFDAMIERLRKQEIPNERESFGPSLGDFMREKGLADKVLAGELAGLKESDRTRKPGQRSIIREDGIDLDTAAQLAAEAGYIDEATPNALLTALDDEIRGNALKFSEKKGGNPEAQAMREALAMLEDSMREAGVDIGASNQEIRKALADYEEKQAQGGSDSAQEFSQAEPDAAPMPDTIEIDGKQRPTLNSDGKRIAQTEEQVRNFWRWFGDSKVVDEQGRPLVVYHGTGAAFDSFDKSKQGNVTQARSAKLAIFFTADKKTAQAYSVYASEDAPVKELLKQADQAERAGNWDKYDELLQQAERLDTNKGREELRKNARVLEVYLKGEKPKTEDAEGKSPQDLTSDDNIDSWLSAQIKETKRKGADILVIKNLDDAVGLSNRPADHFAVFDSNQIKSATGNRGTFDPSNPSILGQGTVTAPKSGRLDLEALLKQWRKATGDRTPIGGIEAWQQLVEESEAVEQDRRIDLARDGGVVYTAVNGRPRALSTGQTEGGPGGAVNESVNSPRRRYDTPGQQTFLSPEGEAEKEIARGKTSPKDDKALASILSGGGGSIAAGERITDLINNYVERDIPVTPLAGHLVSTPRDAAALLAAFRSPFAERTAWLLVGSDGKVKRNGLFAVGTIDSALMPNPRELEALLDDLKVEAGDTMVWSHNHPSGNPSPSRADISVYSRLFQALRKRGANFDGLVLNGSTFYHGVGVHGEGDTIAEGTRGEYKGGENFRHEASGVTFTSPDMIADYVKSLSISPGSTLAIHTSPRMQVVAIEAWSEAPSPDVVDKSRRESAAAASFIVTTEANAPAYMTKSGHSRIPDVIALGEGGAFRSLRAQGEYRPKYNTDMEPGEAVVNVVREDGTELEQPGKKEARRGSVKFKPGAGPGRKFLVNIFSGADVSTMLHEVAGHVMLEMMGDLATEPDAPADLVADYRTVRDWFAKNAKDIREQAIELEEQGKARADVIAELRAATDESIAAIAENFRTPPRDGAGARLHEAMHEYFARGQEAYILEGKAPTPAMRGVFARLAEWLKVLYRSAKNLRVNISPEIRAVFDRLVAADDAVEEAEAEAGIDVTLPREVFDSLEEWEKHQKSVAESRADARARVSTRLLAELNRESTKAWKAKREEIEAEVENAVNAAPVYQAISALQSGTTPDGIRLPDEYQGLKLDRADLVQQWGEEVIKRLPGPASVSDNKANRGGFLYAAEGGLPIDQVARMWGFGSGNALIEAMIQADDRASVIRAETDQRMQALNPDPMTDGSLADQAHAALATDRRAELLRSELNALGRRTGQTPAPIEVMRELARDRIANVRAYDLAPDKFRIASAKAARRVVDAAARKDWNEAYRSKLQEVLNLEMYRAARDAKEAGEAGRAYLRRFDTLAKRQWLGKLGTSGVGQWMVFDKEGLEVGAFDTMEQARAVWQQQPTGATYRRTNGYLEQVLGILEGYSLRGVSTRQLRRREQFRKWIARSRDAGEEPFIEDSVIDDLGEVSWNDLTVAKQADVVNAVRNIEARARQKDKLLKAAKEREMEAARQAITSAIVTNQPKPLQDEQSSGPLTTLLDAPLRFIDAARKDSHLAYAMDGYKDGGAVWEYFIRPRNEATTESELVHIQEAEAYRRLFQEWGKTKGVAATSIPGTTLKLRLEERIMLAAHWGNAEGRDRVAKRLRMTGHGLPDVQAVIDSLDAADWRLINGMSQLINKHFPDVAALEQRVTGIAPEKVQALPFVTAKHGTQPGGYFPLKYDERLSKKAGDLAAEMAARENARAVGARAQTRHGHTNLRAREIEGLAVRLDFGLVAEHLAEVVHDLSHREMLLDQNKLLRDESIKDAIISRHGRRAYRELIDTAGSIANRGRTAGGALSPYAASLRRGVSASVFTYQLTSALMNLTGFLNSLTRVGPLRMLGALGRVGGDALTMTNTMAWVDSKSGLMRARGGNVIREVGEAMREIGPGGKLQTFIRAGYWPMRQVQRIVDTVTWVGAYEQSMAEQTKSGLPFEEAEARAIAIADQIVTDTQGSARVGDLSSIERDGELSKMFTLFFSWMNTTQNLTRGQVGRILRNPTDPATLIGASALLLMMGPVQVVMTDLIRAVLRGDQRDDEERLQRFARQQAGFLLGQYIFARELSGPVEGGFDYSGPAALRAIVESAKLAARVAESGDVSELAGRPLVNVIGALTGLPTRAALQLVDGWQQMEEGEGADGLRTVLFGKPLKDPR